MFSSVGRLFRGPGAEAGAVTGETCRESAHIVLIPHLGLNSFPFWSLRSEAYGSEPTCRCIASRPGIHITIRRGNQRVGMDIGNAKKLVLNFESSSSQVDRPDLAVSALDSLNFLFAKWISREISWNECGFTKADKMLAFQASSNSFTWTAGKMFLFVLSTVWMFTIIWCKFV